MNIPQKIGPYTIEKVLGQGGMGIVYLGSHSEFPAKVAIKTIRVRDNFQIDTIRREIHALRQISHPGIVPVIDDGLFEGIPWYTMPFLEGLTLRQYFQKKRYATSHIPPSTSRTTQENTEQGEGSFERTLALTDATSSDSAPDFTSQNDLYRPPVRHSPIEDIIRIIIHLCEPLSYLHGEGMVHRDIKPDNVIIREDEKPILVDFGLITAFQGQLSREKLFVEGGYVGTVSYMSPEQIHGVSVDARTDIYAIGCILYELLTGHPPFVGNRIRQIVQAHLSAMPIAPQKFRADIPDELNDLVLRLLSKRPQDRIGYADVLATQLAQINSDPLEGIFQTQPKSYLYRPRFTGHTDVFIMIQDKLKSLLHGTGSFTFLEGESGVGKTRILVEIGREAVRQNIRVITGEFSSQRTETLAGFTKFFSVLADYCRMGGEEVTTRLLGKNGGILSPYAPELEKLPGQEKYDKPPELSVAASKLRLFSALLDTVVHFAREQSLLIILDDVHWADDLTIEFFEFLFSSDLIDKPQFMMLNSYKGESVSDKLNELLSMTGISRCTLQRLPDSDIASIVGDMLALDEPPLLFSQYMAKHAEGNPLFAAEYLRAAVEEKVLWRNKDGIWHVSRESEDEFSAAEIYERLALPLSLQGLIERRLAGISPGARKCIAIFSIIGRETDLSLLKTVCQLTEQEIHELIRELEVKQLIEINEENVLRITHRTIRELALSQLHKTETIQLHRHIAEELEDRKTQNRKVRHATLGYHWAGALEYKKARKHYLLAAKNAKTRFDYREAHDFYSSYLKLLDGESPESIQIRLEYAVEVLIAMGKIDAAFSELRHVSDRANEWGLNDVYIRSQLAMATIHRDIGEIETAASIFETIIDQANKRELTAFECNARINYGILMYNTGSLEKALKFNEEALDIARQLGDRSLLIQVMLNVGVYSQGLKPPDEVKSYLEEALQLSREIQNTMYECRVLANIGIFYRDLGKLNEARTIFDESLVIVSEAGEKFLENAILLNLGLTLIDLGEPEQARKHFKTCIKLSKLTKDKRKEAISLGLLAAHSEDVLPFEDIRNLYENALILNREVGDKRFEAQNLLNFGRCLFDQGLLDQAYDSYSKAYSLARETGDKRLYAACLTLQAVLERIGFGNFDEAEKKLQESYELIQALNNPLEIINHLIQFGHNALAQGESAEEFITEIEEILKNNELSDENRVNNSVKELKIAQNLFSHEYDNKLFRGEPIHLLQPMVKKHFVAQGLIKKQNP